MVYFAIEHPYKKGFAWLLSCDFGRTLLNNAYIFLHARKGGRFLSVGGGGGFILISRRTRCTVVRAFRVNAVSQKSYINIDSNLMSDSGNHLCPPFSFHFPDTHHSTHIP